MGWEFLFPSEPTVVKLLSNHLANTCVLAEWLLNINSNNKSVRSHCACLVDTTLTSVSI